MNHVTGSELLDRLFRSIDAQPTHAACELVQAHGNVCGLHRGHSGPCFVLPPEDTEFPYPFSEAVTERKP